ncbi:nuclear transport factor 2 family protein [Natrinema caseinilyticum]|uniref:nuclear transport factor 2 family protein n=1 Tax=Natrinema caseinilyticum TaxID=2961570 RepID=UPI0020C48E0D|nr:nuclear transport factor 2 family protein [Natrinema caseinilyticum]
MNRENRNHLIDTYFEAMDEDNFDAMEAAVSDSIQFESPGGTVSDVDEFREYIEESRIFTHSEHDVTRRVHGAAKSVCEGTVSGQTPEGRVDGEFCDVFGFDGDEEQITDISVYTRM